MSGIQRKAFQGALGQHFDSEEIPLLRAIDNLRNLNIEREVSIPQICVFGDQSSGKSSVLEALSNIPFPRGVGLVTRCPIRIRLYKSNTWQANAKIVFADQHSQHWNSYKLANENKDADDLISNDVDRDGDNSNQDLNNHLLGQQDLQDMAAVGKRIEELSLALSQRNNGEICQDAIEIEIQSPDSPNLTLVDLPGIVRTTTGLQNSRSIAGVDAMLEKYLRQERTIVLAVIPANQDIATIDILERAQRVDPYGNRTLGVLTKPDLVDEGAEKEHVLDVLDNTIKPLKLGYVVVKNRSQKQVNENSVSISDMEMDYFRNHSVYSQLDPAQCGTKALSTKLSHILIDMIRREITNIKISIQNKLAERETKLENLGASVPLNKYDMGKYLTENVVQEMQKSLHKNETYQSVYKHLQKLIKESLEPALTNTCPEVDKGEEFLYCSSSESFSFCYETRDSKNPDWNTIEKTEISMADLQAGDYDWIIDDENDNILFPVNKTTGIQYDGITNFIKLPRDAVNHGCGVLKSGDTVTLEVDSEKCEGEGVKEGDALYILKVHKTNSFKEKIFEQLKGSVFRELAGLVSHDSFAKIIQKLTSSWENPVLATSKTIVGDLRNELLNNFEAATSLSRERFPILIKQVEQTIIKFTDKKGKEFADFLSKLLEAEATPYSTINISVIVNEIRTKRAVANRPKGSDEEFEKWYSRTHRLGLENSDSHEVQEMVDYYNAYVEIALRRFLDNVCMHMNRVLIADFEGNLMKFILKEIEDHGNFETYFEEPQNIADRRKKLETDIERFQNALMELDKVHRGKEHR